MQNSIKLNFYSIGVMVTSSTVEVIDKLKNDFSYFIVNDFKQTDKIFSLEIEQGEYQDKIPTDQVVKKQTENSLYYDVGDIRYNDYYGKALSIMDYQHEAAKVYFVDQDFIHELAYLMILSRTGKLLDQKGMHKIHACGVHRDGKNLIFMMPSKGGKTTLFAQMISDEKIDIISDDTPIITQKGEVLPFPLRIGSESKKFLQDIFPYIQDEDLVLFERISYSKKYLLGLTKLKNKIHAGKKNILVVGFRSSFKTPVIKKIGSMKMLKHTLEHMVVGIGLPMIVEYFLRNNFKDHIVNFSIFLSRLRAAVNLVFFSENYEIYCSSDINLNKQMMVELLNER